MKEEVNKEKSFGIDVGGKVAELVQQREHIETDELNGGSVVSKLRELKAKYHELFEAPERLPSPTREIVLFLLELDKEEAHVQ